MKYSPGEKGGSREPTDIQAQEQSIPNRINSSKNSWSKPVNIKMLLTQLRHKKEEYKSWKQGQVTQEVCRFAVKSCKDGVKNNANYELNLAKNRKGNKKGFYK